MALAFRRPRPRSAAAAAALALSVLSAAGALAAAPAAAASGGFIAVPNGLVGVPETITVNAPNAKGQVVTVGLQLGSVAQTLQTTIGSNGYGSVSWTPAASGTWVFNGLGVIAGAGSATATVAPMPTYTVLLAQNLMQTNVQNQLLVASVAPIGTLAPTGVVTLQAGGSGATLASAPLAGSLGSNTSTATVVWTPAAGSPTSLQAQYFPASGGQLGSTSPVSQTAFSSGPVTVAVRWPSTLYAGTPTILQAVTGPGVPAGSAAFAMDGSMYLGGSNPTVNGVATLPWTPIATGLHTLSAAFAGGTPTNGVYPVNGQSSQQVLIQPARPVDNITVDPPSQPVWSIAQPIVMRAGANATLLGSSESGTPVVFSEQGPCVISGAVLTALSPGQCQVTAISPGTAAIAPGSETYTITVQAPPRKAR